MMPQTGICNMQKTLASTLAVPLIRGTLVAPLYPCAIS